MVFECNIVNVTFQNNVTVQLNEVLVGCLQRDDF